jgi:hypothetical protein
MKKVTTFFSLATIAMGLAAFSTGSADPTDATGGEFWNYPSNGSDDLEAPLTLAPRNIDLAICLDTSGSMDGLIESAKQRLWALVNDLGKATPTPQLRISLMAFGSPEYGADNGWVKTLLPLTTDLDLVSMKLFELQTNGGDEYVARATDAAVKQLDWSTAPGALKMIVIAGNESADQDPILTVEQASFGAADKGILVHALYCSQTAGPQQKASQGQALQGQFGINQQVVHGLGPVAASSPAIVTVLDEIALGWKKVSTLAGGAFAMINQDSGVIVIDTPYDDGLISLSDDINSTYIAYGVNAGWNLSNQIAQDSNAACLNTEAAASRAQTKGGKLYVCSWDLVDALESGQVELGTIDTALLAEELRTLSAESLGKLIETKRTERTRIQGEIDALGVKREAFLVTKRAEIEADESEAFDSVLRKAFRKEAAAKGFVFPAPIAPLPEVSRTEIMLDDC